MTTLTDTRCEGGYVSIEQEKTIGKRAECPSCGRMMAFHAVTGKFRAHLRPAEEDELVSNLHGPVRREPIEEATDTCSLATIEVGYTNSDDGVWLDCRVCDWRHNVGFFSSVTELVAAANVHLGRQ